MIEHETVSGQLFQKRLIFQIIFDDCTISLFHEISRFFKIYPDCFEVCIYGAQNETYMSRSAEKWVKGLCFNELGVGG